MNKYLVVCVKNDRIKEKIKKAILENIIENLGIWPEKINFYEKNNYIIFSGYSKGDRNQFQFNNFTFQVTDGYPIWNTKIDLTNFNIDKKSINHIYDNIDGNYSFNLIDSINDSSVHFNDFLGLSHSYYFENEDFIAISNRQFVLNCIVNSNQRVNPNLDSLSWLPYQASLISFETPFKGVMRIPNGFYVYIKNATMHLEQFNFQCWSKVVDKKELKSEDFDEITNILINQSIRLKNQLNKESLTLSLTGGKDSRLVLALALQSGLIENVSTIYTNGKEGSPEIEAAAMICHELGLEHVAKFSRASAFDLNKTIGLLQYHTFKFDASVCAWDGLSDTSKSISLELNGMGGELLSIFAKGLKGLDLKTREEAKIKLENYQQKTDPLGVLNSSIKSVLKSSLNNTIDINLDRGYAYNDLLDVLFVDYRLSTWSGMISQNTMAKQRFYPIANKEASKIAFSTGNELRHNAVFHYEILKRLDERLVRLPFLGTTWSEKVQRRAIQDKLKTAQEPFISSKQLKSQNLVAWQWSFLEQGWGYIKDLLLSSPNSNIFDIVDKKRLEAVLSGSSQSITSVIELKEILSLVGIQNFLTGSYSKRFEGVISKIKMATNINDVDFKFKGTSVARYKLLENKVIDFNFINANAIDRKISHKQAQVSEYIKYYNRAINEFYNGDTSEVRYFDLPNSYIKNLRIDPISCEGEFNLGPIVLINERGSYLISCDGKMNLSIRKHLNLIKEETDSTTYNSIGNDPILIYLNPDNIELKGMLMYKLKSNITSRTELFIDTGKGYNENDKLMNDN